MQIANHVYFTAEFKSYYSAAYREIDAILSRHGVAHGLLKGTADYWCRDFMPVQTAGGEFVQFRYHPDYLKDEREYETPTEVSVRLVEELTKSAVKRLPMVADGGNFTLATVRNGQEVTPVVVMTEKIFFENPEMDREEVCAQLRALFPKHEFIFLPWDREDTCGHTDGILHAVGDNKVLVNLALYPEDIAEQMRRALSARFEVIDLELSTYPVRSWAYINMIQTDRVIIVPGLGASTDGEALAQIKSLFPEYEGRIYQVKVPPTIIGRGGALNCISWSFAL